MRQVIRSRKSLPVFLFQLPQLEEEHFVEAGDVAQAFVQPVQQHVPFSVLVRMQALVQCGARGCRIEDVAAQMQRRYNRCSPADQQGVLLIQSHRFPCAALPQYYDNRHVPHLVQP
ncbi:hypothetical protein [Streptomyces sp. NPDC058398]|uniref:hypothetical protein n=1 Tax=Streptomyces sp. NPDC058398 TaxID=3346479 RepID=UPI003653DB1E